MRRGRSFEHLEAGGRDLLVPALRPAADRVLELPHTPADGATGRSHTAAALRGDAVIDALLRQAGVLRLHSSEELSHVAQLFESQPLPIGRSDGGSRS